MADYLHYIGVGELGELLGSFARIKAGIAQNAALYQLVCLQGLVGLALGSGDAALADGDGGLQLVGHAAQLSNLAAIEILGKLHVFSLSAPIAALCVLV